uniref:GNAT family N-acetyltransferase n=1 Tax=Acidocella sp. TaxID=50710 RepID=UPI0038D07D82
RLTIRPLRIASTSRMESEGREAVGVLVSGLLERARAAGFSQVLSLIGGAENAAFIGGHASLGFQHAGTIRNIGYKFNRWLHAIIMRRFL